MGERTTQESTGVRKGRHWEKQATCLSERGKISLEKAQVINSRASENKAIYNQSLATILLEAHTPLPRKIVKNQDKLGPPHPATIFLLYNSLKGICLLSRNSLAHSCYTHLSGLQSIFSLASIYLRIQLGHLLQNLCYFTCYSHYLYMISSSILPSPSLANAYYS